MQQNYYLALYKQSISFYPLNSSEHAYQKFCRCFKGNLRLQCIMVKCTDTEEPPFLEKKREPKYIVFIKYF